SLALLMLFQFFHWRGLAAGFLLILVGGIGAYVVSDTVRERMDFTLQDLTHYEDTGERMGSTSIRLEFQVNALHIALQNPWLGTGTGSFKHEYERLRETKKLQQSSNPHNEYLLIWINLGVPGLLGFIVLLIVFARTAYQLPLWTCRQLHGLLMLMAVGCTINSFLMDSTESYTFVLLAAIWLNETQTDESEK
ncbi:MAG: O-antigen ligase family protein, partial [Pseudomonadota bacterium]